MVPIPSAADQVTSLTGIGGNTKNGPVAFTTTQWSVVLAAQGPTPAAQAALDKICRTYWRPIYGFVRRQGVAPEESKDLTQGFFALLLERRDLNAVRQEKGRLRSYLLTSLKHFLTNERHRAMAIKRGQGQQLIPLEDLHERELAGFEPAETLAADQIYQRRWALSVLDQVLGRLGDEYRWNPLRGGHRPALSGPLPGQSPKSLPEQRQCESNRRRELHGCSTPGPRREDSRALGSAR